MECNISLQCFTHSKMTPKCHHRIFNVYNINFNCDFGINYMLDVHYILFKVKKKNLTSFASFLGFNPTKC